MKRGLSIGNKTKAEQARLDAIKGVGCILCHYPCLMLEEVRAEFGNMAGQNRRVA
ncbi:hypothetical protein [Stenotrophomonas sp.]|uniref:hypothetical protein n=1 Tax=Stenotrophomonas sp. TaxID=69392 RepID=UPI0028A6FB78|nr:hypothetical protein [Stenotrophomonas sp.]